MIRQLVTVLVFWLAPILAFAQPSLPANFQAKTIHSAEGADIFVRWGGRGPVVLLLHGYAENSDSWAPLAADLMKDQYGRGARSPRNRAVLKAGRRVRQENPSEGYSRRRDRAGV